jgi:hypothetical protein
MSEGGDGLRARRRHPDLTQIGLGLGFGLQRLGQDAQDVGGLVHPAALTARLRIHLLERSPEAQRPIAHGQQGTGVEPANCKIAFATIPLSTIARSGLTNVNSSISGDSGYKTRPRAVLHEGVSGGEEESFGAAHTARAQPGVQDPSGPGRREPSEGTTRRRSCAKFAVHP